VSTTQHRGHNQVTQLHTSLLKQRRPEHHAYISSVVARDALSMHCGIQIRGPPNKHPRAGVFSTRSQTQAVSEKNEARRVFPEWWFRRGVSLIPRPSKEDSCTLLRREVVDLAQATSLGTVRHGSCALQPVVMESCTDARNATLRPGIPSRHRRFCAPPKNVHDKIFVNESTFVSSAPEVAVR